MKYQAKTKFSILIFFIISLLLLGGCGGKYADAVGMSATVKDGQVVISWQTAESALNYRLYRKKETDDDYKFLADISGTSYSDTQVSAGTEYRYKLRVVYERGLSDGIITDIISFAKTDEGEAGKRKVTEAVEPIIESVTQLDKYTAVVLFSENTENNSIEVLRSESETGDFQVIGTTDGKAYYDTTADNGIPYYYMARVKDGVHGKEHTARQIGYNSKKTVRIPVFMYHEFVSQEDLNSGIAFDEYAIWQSELEEDLVWLKENGYNTITTKELCDFLEGKGTLPSNPILLTIDDGKYGVYKRAYPLLKKYNMKMTLAVIGQRIELASHDPIGRGGADAPYSTWDEIGEMSRSGVMEIISHTFDLHIFHRGKRQGANTSEDDTEETFLPIAQRDFLKMSRKFRDVIGRSENNALAYPYSKRSVLSDTVWLKCGYKLLLGGDDPKERRTHSNYFIAEAGINRDSAVMRRIARMTGTSISEYLDHMEQQDN